MRDTFTPVSGPGLPSLLASSLSTSLQLNRWTEQVGGYPRCKDLEFILNREGEEPSTGGSQDT